MATIYIRDVPDETHEELKRRAVAAGVSLQRYLLDKLNEDARRPSLRDMLRKAEENAQDGGGEFAMEEIVDAVHSGRR